MEHWDVELTVKRNNIDNEKTERSNNDKRGCRVIAHRKCAQLLLAMSHKGHDRSSRLQITVGHRTLAGQNGRPKPNCGGT